MRLKQIIQTIYIKRSALLFSGIGKTLAYGPGVVIVGMYFSRRRGIAVGLGTSGVALGAFAVPTLVEFSFSEYGYFGAFIIMTGIALQLVVCGFLLRPLSLHKQITEYDRRFVYYIYTIYKNNFNQVTC